MEELRIDPEFQGKIPPLTEAEFKQLEENILEAGEVYEPIVVWNGVIVDGHNRYKIVTEHPEIKWKTREMEFADRWDAIAWMYKNQLGRRNLTEQSWTTLVGDLAMARMRSHGGDRKSSGQNDTLIGRTRDIVADELGISPRTVDRAIGFAKGMNAIRNENNDTADKILKGELTPKKVDVVAVGKAQEEDRPDMVRKIAEGKRVTAIEAPEHYSIRVDGQYNGGGTSEYREKRQKIAEYVADLYSTDDEVEYTVKDLLSEIESNAESFLCILRNMMNDHETLVKENAETVTAFITEKIINEIMKIERCVEE